MASTTSWVQMSPRWIKFFTLRMLSYGEIWVNWPSTGMVAKCCEEIQSIPWTNFQLTLMLIIIIKGPYSLCFRMLTRVRKFGSRGHNYMHCMRRNLNTKPLYWRLIECIRRNIRILTSWPLPFNICGGYCASACRINLHCYSVDLDRFRYLILLGVMTLTRYWFDPRAKIYSRTSII